MIESELYTVRESAIEGRGVFALVEIKAGSRVGYFVGHPTDDQDDPHAIWTWNEETEEWDGLHVENELRYLNHHRPPNAEVSEDGVRALRLIEAGEELTIDYGTDWA